MWLEIFTLTPRFRGAGSNLPPEGEGIIERPRSPTQDDCEVAVFNRDAPN